MTGDRALDLCFGMGQMRGFFTSSLKFAHRDLNSGSEV
jgi:hypothetical protein